LTDNDAVADSINPPVISNPLPSGTIASKSVTISVDTNEEAVCRYGNENVDYQALCNEFETTGGTHHTAEVCRTHDLEERSYTYYVKCKDSYGNVNTAPATIQFIVDYDYAGGDTTPPQRFNCQPDGPVYQKM